MVVFGWRLDLIWGVFSNLTAGVIPVWHWCFELSLWQYPQYHKQWAVLPHSAHGIDSPSCRLWSIPGQLCGSWEGHAEHTSTAPGTLKGHCTPGCIHCSGQALNSCCLALGRLYWDNCAQSKTTPEMLLEWCESCGGQVSLSENWDTPEEKQREDREEGSAWTVHWGGVRDGLEPELSEQEV